MCENNLEEARRITRSRLQLLSSEKKQIYFEKLGNKIKGKKQKETELSTTSVNSNTNFKMTLTRSPSKTTDGETSGGERLEESTMKGELQKERRSLEQAQRQLELDRLAIEQERATLNAQLENVRNQPRSGETAHRQVDDSVALNGLVRQLQSVNVEIKTPIFAEDKNPLNFIIDLDRYFKVKGIHALNHMLVLENILEGRVGDWFYINKDNIIDFDDFKSKFKNEFYPIPVQFQFRQQWASRKYVLSNGSMLSFFYSQYREGVTLEPQSPPYDIIFRITQQFPSNIRNSLAVIDCSRLESVTQALAQLDNVAINNVDHEGQARNSFDKRVNSNHRQVNSFSHSNQKVNKHANTYSQFNHRYNPTFSHESRGQAFNMPDLSTPPPPFSAAGHRNNQHLN